MTSLHALQYVVGRYSSEVDIGSLMGHRRGNDRIVESISVCYFMSVMVGIFVYIKLPEHIQAVIRTNFPGEKITSSHTNKMRSSNYTVKADDFKKRLSARRVLVRRDDPQSCVWIGVRSHHRVPRHKGARITTVLELKRKE